MCGDKKIRTQIWVKRILFLEYVRAESSANQARADAKHQNLFHRPYIVRLLVDCPPQAEIFWVSTHQILLKITIFEGFQNKFEPQIPKFSACGGFYKKT